MEDKSQLLKVYSRPQLREPILIAGAPSTANVTLRVANYLREKLGAELFAEIEPGDFFTPPYAFTFQNGLVELAELEFAEVAPQNRFYYWQSGKEHDLVLFMGNAQPLVGKVPELAGYILDVARSFNVTRLLTAGAFITDIHHLDEPVVYGTATNTELRAYLDSYGIPPSPSMNIAHNLIAWLLGTAKKKDFDAIGLVSEIPFYNAEGTNIRACRAQLRVLCQMLELEQVDLSDLNNLIAEEEARMEQYIAELRQSTDEKVVEFLRYFEQLRGRRVREAGGYGTQPLVPVELPESLKYIETLYEQALVDKSKAAAFSAELDKLGSFDRLLVLRKYGNDLLKLLGRQM